MKEKKLKPLSDEEVLTLVEGKVRKGVGWFDSKLSKERERVIKYYNSELPLRQSNGRSSYVSTDVYDSVESMKAQLLETFSGNPDSLVKFPPLQPDDIESSRIATEYCSYQVWAMNDGFDIFQSVIHDGLTARVGIVKVFWEECYDDIEEEFSGASLTDVQAMQDMEDIPDFDATADENSPDPMNPTFSGKRTKRIDRSKVSFVNVPPEEFVIEDDATSIQSAGMCGQHTLKTRQQLKDEGYDKKKVDEINWDDARSLDLSPEKIERRFPVSDSTLTSEEAIQDDVEKVMLYETFVYMNMKDGRGVKLYKVCHAGNILLEREEVDRKPFFAFVPLPVPHSFFGNNFAARVVPTQNARTVLTRAILDHASITTTPRWTVLNNALMNPKEMLDNRLGGIVNLRRENGVRPLEQQPLNPFLYQTLEMLKQNKEESTGISSLSQGLNKDAISTQNSSALVDNLVTLSQQRQKIVARNFASFLVQVYLETYRLVLENEKKQRIIEVAGNWQPINVEGWIERTTCKVSLHLGYGERDRQAAKFSGLYQQLASDPGLAPMFKPENKYALATDGMKAGAFDNWSKYLTTPDKIETPQPDPLKVRELEIKDKTATASMMTAQAASKKSDWQAQIAAMKEQLAALHQQIESQLDERENMRQDMDTANRINVSQREMALLEVAPPEAEKAIVSPAPS